MKVKSKTAMYILLTGILLMTQYAFFIAPNMLVMPYHRIIRPAVYVSVFIIIFIFTDKGKRPVPKGRQSLIIANLGILMYFMAMFAIGLLFGFGKNPMAPGFAAVINNLWIYGTLRLMAELIRFTIIKNTPDKNRLLTCVIITAAFALLELDDIRSALNFGFSGGWAAFFFGFAFPSLAVNAALTYMAFESSFTAVLLMRFAYSLTPVLLPVLPNVPKTVWAVVSNAVLFVTLIIYSKNMSDRSGRQKQAVKKRAKYRKSPVSACALSAAAALLLAFTLRVFSYFPVAVLTGSMAGAIDRGSVVFIEKLNPENVIVNVKEGDVIHYKHRDVEIIHRVVEFSYNSMGERMYITKGDANPSADAYFVEREQILGIARAKIPYIGYPFVIFDEITDN